MTAIVAVEKPAITMQMKMALKRRRKLFFITRLSAKQSASQARAKKIVAVYDTYHSIEMQRVQLKYTERSECLVRKNKIRMGDVRVDYSRITHWKTKRLL